jgi:hypothetical protein
MLIGGDSGADQMRIRVIFSTVAILMAMPAMAQSNSQSAASDLPTTAGSAAPALLVDSDATLNADVPDVPSTPDLSLPRWQLWFGFKGERYEEFRGGPVGNAISDYDFWTYGMNLTVTRYFNKWLGLDAGITPGWGHTTAGSHLVTQSIDWGVGPRFALRGRHHIEPFVRTSIGSVYFHFDHSGALPASLNSFQYTAGAGSGFKLSRKIWWTLEVDYMGTHFFSNNQKDVELRSQVVFNF